MHAWPRLINLLYFSILSRCSAEKQLLHKTCGHGSYVAVPSVYILETCTALASCRWVNHCESLKQRLWEGPNLNNSCENVSHGRTSCVCHHLGSPSNNTGGCSYAATCMCLRNFPLNQVTWAQQRLFSWQPLRIRPLGRDARAMDKIICVANAAQQSQTSHSYVHAHECICTCVRNAPQASIILLSAKDISCKCQECCKWYRAK